MAFNLEIIQLFLSSLTPQMIKFPFHYNARRKWTKLLIAVNYFGKKLHRRCSTGFKNVTDEERWKVSFFI